MVKESTQKPLDKKTSSGTLKQSTLNNILAFASIYRTCTYSQSKYVNYILN